jgi:hypothetical protein
MNESKPSTDATGNGPQMSVWIISNTHVLRFAPFLICLINLPLMQFMHCSKSLNSNGRRIDSLTKRSILPLEIWPKRQCHNFDDTLSIRFRFLLTFVDDTTFAFSHTESTHSEELSWIANMYSLSYRMARPTTTLFNLMEQCFFWETLWGRSPQYKNSY